MEGKNTESEGENAWRSVEIGTKIDDMCENWWELRERGGAEESEIWYLSTGREKLWLTANNIRIRK